MNESNNNNNNAHEFRTNFVQISTFGCRYCLVIFFCSHALRFQLAVAQISMYVFDVFALVSDWPCWYLFLKLLSLTHTIYYLHPSKLEHLNLFLFFCCILQFKLTDTPIIAGNRLQFPLYFVILFVCYLYLTVANALSLDWIETFVFHSMPFRIRV